MKRARLPITAYVGLLVSFSYLLAFMQRTGPGVVSHRLQSEFHVSSAVLGTMSSIQYFLYMILQIPVGLTADSVGPEQLLFLGVLLDGLGTLIFSTAHTFAILLVGRAVVGLGDALIWVNIVLILGRYFAPRLFGRMLAVTSTAGNIGALLTTIPFAALTTAVGWRLPFRALGILLVLTAIVTLLVLRVAKRQTPPEQHLHVEHVPVWHTLHSVVRDRNAWATFTCHFGAVGNYVSFVSLWAVPYFISAYHTTASHATVFTLVAFIGGLTGGPIAGAISDRLGNRRSTYRVTQALMTLAWLVFPILNGHPPAFLGAVAMFFVGFGSGASLLTFAVIRETSPPSRAGVMSGFANTGGFLSAVLLPVLFGGIIDVISKSDGGTLSSHAFAMAFLLPTLFSFLGFIGALFIREKSAQDVLASAV